MLALTETDFAQLGVDEVLIDGIVNLPNKEMLRHNGDWVIAMNMVKV